MMGIRLVAGPARRFLLEEDGFSFDTAEGRLRCDAAYPALGSDVHSDLAADLGAALRHDGRIVVDAH